MLPPSVLPNVCLFVLFMFLLFFSSIFVNTSDAFESVIPFLSFIFLEFILVIGTFSPSDELSDSEPELLSELSVPEPISDESSESLS